MNRFTRTLIAMLAALSPALADDDGDLRGVVSSYQQALNDNDAGAVARLFTDDGIAMIQGTPTTTGSAALRTLYGTLFKRLDFDIAFEVAEVVPMSERWALVRTTSSGTVKVLANGSTVANSGQELLVLEKTGAQWKIARYAASSTK